MFFFRSTLSHVCPDSSVVSKCVLSAHIGHYKHIDPWTSDTAGCHVWRACAHRLTAQGYLKGCANFALFTAPINSVCFSERLCMVLKLDVGWSMLRMPAMLSCFCVSHVCAGYTDVHWPLRLFASPPVLQWTAMSQFSTMSTRERKIQAAAICREFHGQEGSHVISSSLSCFLVSVTTRRLLFPSHLAPFTSKPVLFFTH